MEIVNSLSFRSARLHAAGSNKRPQDVINIRITLFVNQKFAANFRLSGDAVSQKVNVSADATCIRISSRILQVITMLSLAAHWSFQFINVGRITSGGAGAWGGWLLTRIFEKLFALYRKR